MEPTKQIKMCHRCGRTWDLIPANAVMTLDNTELDGAWWDCPCGSTMFLPLYSIEELRAA